MSLKIDKARIKSGDLTEAEINYLRQRNRLPKEFLVPEPQEPPTIGYRGGIVDTDDEEEDYEEGWTNDMRRARLVELKLSIDGRKDDLIARLRRHDQGQLQDEDYSNLED
jgi:hypothetical protein